MRGLDSSRFSAEGLAFQQTQNHVPKIFCMVTIHNDGRYESHDCGDFLHSAHNDVNKLSRYIDRLHNLLSGDRVLDLLVTAYGI